MATEFDLKTNVIVGARMRSTICYIKRRIMKLAHKALACAAVTEAIALTFVYCDRLWGIASPTWSGANLKALHDTDYARWQRVTFCWRVAKYTHRPASITVALTVSTVGAVLGVPDLPKALSFYFDPAPGMSWLTVGTVQAGIWFCCWYLVIHLTTRETV
jgi:hypothetical protein